MFMLARLVQMVPDAEIGGGTYCILWFSGTRALLCRGPKHLSSVLPAQQAEEVNSYNFFGESNLWPIFSSE